MMYTYVYISSNHHIYLFTNIIIILIYRIIIYLIIILILHIYLSNHYLLLSNIYIYIYLGKLQYFTNLNLAAIWG